MKKATLLPLLLLLSWAHAQQLPLSPTATASIITCGAGNDFYTTFGHSAVHIVDTARNIDYVYNYGTFNFDTPHFYWKFTQGRLDYTLSRTSFDHFMQVYYSEQRAVWEQPLNMTPQEIGNLFLLLETNYLPQYRNYRYDFFRDNCATRVRDIIESAYGHTTIHYDSTLAGHSYRHYLHQSMRDTLEWWALGIDCLLGLPADHKCDIREVMFHPILMMNTLANSRITPPLAQTSPIVAPPRQLLPDTRTPLHRSLPPVAVFSLLLVVVALLTLGEKHMRIPHTLMRILDRTLFILAGLIGLFLCFMWFGTDHYCTAWNLNILWASPLLLLIAIRLNRSPHWSLWLQEACFAAAAIWVLVCGLSPALLPVILTLALRIAAQWHR